MRSCLCHRGQDCCEVQNPVTFRDVWTCHDSASHQHDEGWDECRPESLDDRGYFLEKIGKVDFLFRHRPRHVVTSEVGQERGGEVVAHAAKEEEEKE